MKEQTSPTWPYVLIFAKRMEAKLAKNRHKGDREGWLKMTSYELLTRLHVELQELEFELDDPVLPDSENVANECADIANFAMMIADKIKHENGTIK